ncbi:MAG TPA: Calx-beta domain-containing protein [Streptosporangiaceae bacterium]|nr:Calx-beta domain-containing protein [Streptosporangiaceae bacterium]
MHRTIIRGALKRGVLVLAVAVTGPFVATAGGALAGVATPPALSFSGAQAIASPQGATMTFRARLSAASTSPVAVEYATKNGTAVAGTDYVSTSGTLVLAAGSTSGSVEVTLLPVALGAGGSDKTFSLELSHPSGASLSTPSVTGTIHPDVYVASSTSAFQNVVINPSSTTAYLTVPGKNEVAVLNLRTGTYGKPIPVGSDPHGIDITPDGKTLYVCDSGGQTISKVDTATRTVTTITTPPGLLNDTPYSIAIMNNGNALYSTTFAGSGFGANVYNLNLTTDASTVVTAISPVTEATPLSRSADYSTVGAVLGDDSGGPFDIYTAATGNVVSGSLNNFISSSSLNGNGSTVLVDGRYVIDAATGSLLGTISDSCGSSALTALGTTGYCLEAQSIVRLRIKRFLTGKAIALPQPAGGGAQLALSDNGRVLVAETSGGATIVEL